MRLDASLVQLSPEGELIVALPNCLDERLRYGPWKAGLPLHRWVERQWVPESLDPAIPLLHAADQPGSGAPVAIFTAGIPDAIQDAARAYQYLQTTLLQWAAISHAAADLLQQTPHLVWLLAATATTEAWTRREIDHAVSRRRVEIVERVTGGRSEAAVRFLNRIVLHRGDASELRLIRMILDRPAVWQGLGQWTRIPVHLLAVLLQYPELTGSRLLRHIAERDYSRLSDAIAQVRQVTDNWRDALEMARLLAIGDAVQALDRCPTFAAVQRLHDRWMEQLNRRKALVMEGQRRFPEPPIPGSAAIHPILSEEDLQAEGRLMGHCVASYANQVRRGESYIYRLLYPERATLELQRRGTRFMLAQFKAARNQQPRPDAWEVVNQWLKEHEML